MKSVKASKLTAEFLLDSGLLFEINRVVLHPMGLALGINNEADPAEMYLVDHRHDLEGIIFEDDTFVEGETKMRKFFIENKLARKFSERLEKLGFVVQGSPNGKRRE